MLDIYPFILETITMIRPLVAKVCRADPDLHRQLKRAQSSIALNVAEGAYSRGRNQQARFQCAMGSARETLACLEVAAALGEIPPLEDALHARFNRIIGTLHRLSVR
ncbi:MAG: four helix bundle protein [Polyangiaceae bacterium]|nr:four helix bundle protein [Polyangiaceae bacterium]MCB9606180.1 four helix bundle protein [Polyangiaceae bacterium]